MLGQDNRPVTDFLRKRYARVNIYDARNEVSYQAKRSGISMLVRRTAGLAGDAIENSADVIGGFITNTVGAVFEFVLGPELARNLGLFAGGLGGKIAGIAGAGIAGGISAGFAQVDYIHQQQNLRDLYANELAAKLGKPAKDVTLDDLRAEAQKNPVLQEELGRMKKQRNFGIPLAVVATLASFAMATIALPALVPGLAGVGGFLAKIAVSMATYMAVKTPLQAVGGKVFDLYKETANDRIVDIQHAHSRGVAIEPQDLLPVVLGANVGLETAVVKEFGGSYDRLTPEAQEQVLRKVGAVIPLEALARDINSGAINATELAYASIGEASGVPRNITQPGSGLPPAVPQPPQRDTRPFAERIGRKAQMPQSFAERVSQAISEASVGPG